MKKLTTLLALLLCLVLSCTSALADYLPGENASRLIAQAWENGQMLHGDLTLRLDMDGALLGLDGEELQMLNAILPLLDSVSLGFGAGKTEDGIRIELDAALEHAQGGAPVTVNAAANLNLYGFTLESDLFAGKKITGKWETLLAMAGMNDSDIETLLMLRDQDWASILPEALSAIEEYADTAVEMLEPYGETIYNWLMALDVELTQNVVSEGLPTADQLATVTITQKDLGTLITQLATQLKNDAALCLVLDMVIQEAYTGAGEAPSTAQLCDEMIAEAAYMDNTDQPVLLKIAVDENIIPIYIQFIELAGESSGQSISSLIQRTGSNMNSLIELVAVQNEAGNYDYSFQFANRFLNSTNPGSPADRVAISGEIGQGVFTVLCGVYEYGEQVMSLEYTLDSKTSEGELPSLMLTQRLRMTADDGIDLIQVALNSGVRFALTEDQGEVIDSTTAVNVSADGQSVTVSNLETFSLFPAANGLTGSYSTNMLMPAFGINACGVNVQFSSHDYDAAATAALSEIALETSSNADMEALLESILNIGQFKLIALMQALPTEMLNLLLSYM